MKKEPVAMPLAYKLGGKIAGIFGAQGWYRDKVYQALVAEEFKLKMLIFEVEDDFQKLKEEHFERLQEMRENIANPDFNASRDYKETYIALVNELPQFLEALVNKQKAEIKEIELAKFEIGKKVDELASTNRLISGLKHTNWGKSQI